MNKSENLNELATALCKAQNEMGGAVKDAKNPFFKSSYADLTSVIKAIKEPFNNNGLSYSQFIHMLNQSNVTLNRKCLSNMAIEDKASFAKLVAELKKQAA